jgi:hypothetical protein
MGDDTAGPTTSADSTPALPAPFAAADDLLADHWIEPGSNNIHPASPVMATEDDTRGSPLPHNIPSNVATTPTIQHRPVQQDHLEIMLTKLRVDVEAIRLHDRLEIDMHHLQLNHRMDLAESADEALSREIQRLKEELTEEMRFQHLVMLVLVLQYYLLVLLQWHQCLQRVRFRHLSPGHPMCHRMVNPFQHLFVQDLGLYHANIFGWLVTLVLIARHLVVMARNNIHFKHVVVAYIYRWNGMSPAYECSPSLQHTSETQVCLSGYSQWRQITISN